MRITQRIMAILCTVAVVAPYCMINVSANEKYMTSADLAVGDYMVLGTYNEPSKIESEGRSDIMWRIVADNRNDDGKGNTNGKLVVSDEIIANKVYDTPGESDRGSHSRGTTRGERGSNYWPDSNLRSWLNSDEDTIEWLCGVPPLQTSDVTYKGEKGFLTNFTDSEKAVIKEVEQYTHIAKTDYDTGLKADERIKTSDVSGTVEETGNISYVTTESGVCDQYWNTYGQWVKDRIFILDARQSTQLYLDSKSGLFPENYHTLDAFGFMRQPYPYVNESKKLYLQDSRIRVTNGTTYSSTNSADSSVTNQYGSAVRPAFYIDDKASVLYTGSGTEQDPYAPVLYSDIMDEISDADAVEYEIKTLIISDKTTVDKSFDLPDKGKFGTTIVWRSSDEEIISSNGDVNIPYDGVKDNYVTLFAEVKRGEAMQTKQFVFNVRGKELLSVNTDDTVNNNGDIALEVTNNTDKSLNGLKFNSGFF